MQPKNIPMITLASIILIGSLYFMAVSKNQLAMAVTSPSLVVNAANFSTYENASLGVKIQYPSDWKKIEDSRGSWFRNMNESVNLRIESLPFLNGSLDELGIRQINLTEQQFPGQNLIESNETTIGNKYAAHRILFTYPEVPSDLMPKIKELKVWTINGSRAYIISYFTAIEDYGSYFPLAQKIIDSFRIISTNNN